MENDKDIRFDSLSVIVGATDEESSLITTVESITRNCRPGDIKKILIVYSGTATAGCIQTIRQLEREYPQTVCGMKQRRPYIGGAIRDGFDAADSSHIMVLPGDLAIELSPIPLMIETAKKYPGDIVKTSRWLNKNSFFHYSVTRKFFNRLSQLFLRLVFHSDLTDLTNPVQIMSMDVYREINWKEDSFPFLLELVLCPVRLGMTVREVPARCYGRTEGRSKNSAAQTALYFKTALRIRFAPIRQLKGTQ